MIENPSSPIKILDIFPLVYSTDLSDSMKDRQALREQILSQTGGGVELSVASLDYGTASLEGEFDEAINTPFLMEKAKKAERDGFSAIVIDCFGDPGLYPTREIVRIPVVGANQSSVHLASQLGNRFSIINIVEETEGVLRSLAAKYGVADRLASIKTIGVPVLDLERDVERSVRAATDAVAEAVKEDKADVAIFGCTGMSSFVSRVKRNLSIEYSIDIPIIEPLRAAVYTAVSLAFSGNSHSKKAFMYPRPKQRKLPIEMKSLESAAVKEKETEVEVEEVEKEIKAHSGQ